METINAGTVGPITVREWDIVFKAFPHNMPKNSQPIESQAFVVNVEAAFNSSLELLIRQAGLVVFQNIRDALGLGLLHPHNNRYDDSIS